MSIKRSNLIRKHFKCLDREHLVKVQSKESWSQLLRTLIIKSQNIYRFHQNLGLKKGLFRKFLTRLMVRTRSDKNRWLRNGGSRLKSQSTKKHQVSKQFLDKLLNQLISLTLTEVIISISTDPSSRMWRNELRSKTSGSSL